MGSARMDVEQVPRALRDVQLVEAAQEGAEARHPLAHLVEAESGEALVLVGPVVLVARDQGSDPLLQCARVRVEPKPPMTGPRLRL